VALSLVNRMSYPRKGLVVRLLANMSATRTTHHCLRLNFTSTPRGARGEASCLTPSLSLSTGARGIELAEIKPLPRPRLDYILNKEHPSILYVCPSPHKWETARKLKLLRASPPGGLKPTFRKSDVTYRLFNPHPGIKNSR
jgi:hypothetical protein